MHRIGARRPLVALALATLIVASGTRAAAQTQSEVDSAIGDLSRAKQELEAARSAARAALGEVDEAEAERDLVGDDLTAAIAEYQRINGELEDVTFEIALLRDRVVDFEATVRRLRQEARQRAIQAYMTGSADVVDPFFAADQFHEVATGQEILRQATSRDVSEIDRFTAMKREMERVRLKFEDEQARFDRLRDDANLIIAQLDLLFSEREAEVVEAVTDAQSAQGQVSAAEAAVRGAEAAVTDARRRLEEEIARQALALGAGRWRSLIVKYFPASRVDEAVRVMNCESSGDAKARNAASDARGLFQFLASTWSYASVAAGFPGADRYHPEANVAAAAWLVQYSVTTGHPRGAWGHWSCQP